MPALNISLTVDYRPDKPQDDIDELTYAQGLPLPHDEHPVALQGKSIFGSCSDSIRAVGNSITGYCLIIANFFNFAYHATVNDFFEILAIGNGMIGSCYHTFANHLAQTYHYILQGGAMMITAPWNGFIFHLTAFLFIIIAMLLASNDHPTTLPSTHHPILPTHLHQDLDLFLLNLQTPEPFFCLPSKSIIATPQSSSFIPPCPEILQLQHKTHDDLSLSILWNSRKSATDSLRQDFLYHILPKYVELLVRIGAALDCNNSLLASAVQKFHDGKENYEIGILEPRRVFKEQQEKRLTEFEEEVLAQIWRAVEVSWEVVVWVEGMQ
ncbi:hypothetical protein AC578_7338 [Pseudocercospora eumusae]|uniref:Uncharacterized protein n=1 Tax=Pseudocercospora eumusae TaxID=321146 RepID=A0A139HWW0_9PEZI|nr:hypothetical protein AC578_7338 [Pseudocercospora eumusae]